MKTTAFWAGYYGFRSDASEAFIQGYLDEVQRLDQRGQGVACGRGWIPRSKKCSSDKAKQTSKEAKAKTVEKSRERAKLKGEVRAAKGQKPRVKEAQKGNGQPIAPSKRFEMAEAPTKIPRGESARLAATKPLEDELKAVSERYAARYNPTILSGSRPGRVISSAKEGLIFLNSGKKKTSDQYAAAYNTVKKEIRKLYSALGEADPRSPKHFESYS